MSRKEGLMYLRDTKNTEVNFNVKREGITTERNFKISEQEMYANDKAHHTTNFFDNGDDGLSFTITALFTKAEQDKMKLLDKWYTSKHPFKLVFGKHLNLNLPLVSKKWIIIKMTFKQEADNITEWDITFRTYNPPKKIKKVNNKLLNRTTKTYKWSKCKKVYPKMNLDMIAKQKKSECVKVLNSIMIELGYMSKASYKAKTGKKDKKGKAITKTVKYIPDTFTRDTAKAIRKFKKTWNKRKLKPKCKNPESCKIDKNTFDNIGNYKQLKSAKKKK